MHRTLAFLFGLGLTVIVIPWSYQDINAGRWAFAWVGVAVLLFFNREHRYEPIALAFLGLVLLSLLWTPSKLNGVGEALRWLLLGGSFVIGRSGLAEGIFRGAAIGIGVSSLIVLPEYFLDWHWFNAAETGHPAGLFGNRNFLAEAALLVAIPAIWSRNILAVGLCGPALLFTGSRGAIVAATVGGFCALWRSHRTAAIVLAASAAVGVIALSGSISKQHSMENRLAIWQDTIDGLTWTGRGVGSFYATFPEHATRSLVVGPSLIRSEHAHNDYLEIAYEFGPAGLALIMAFVVMVLSQAIDEWSLVFLAFACICTFDYALHNACTAVLGMVAAGELCRRRDMARLGDRWRATDAACRGLLADTDAGRVARRREDRSDRPAVSKGAGGGPHA